MARKKGSRDLKPRKNANRKAKPMNRPPEPEPRHETQAAASPTSINATTDGEFDAAVASVLGNDPSLSRGGPIPGTPGTASPAPSGSPAAIADEEEQVLGRDAWEAIIQAPFRSAAIWLGIPAFEQLGKLRAKMIATPSYPLYRHYVKQWLTDNPDDELFVAKAMTVAVLVTVAQEAYMILRTEAARRQSAAAVETQRKVAVDEQELKQGGSVN